VPARTEGKFLVVWDRAANLLCRHPPNPNIWFIGGDIQPHSPGSARFFPDEEHGSIHLKMLAKRTTLLSWSIMKTGMGTREPQGRTRCRCGTLAWMNSS
jgi:hypothetical protein